MRVARALRRIVPIGGALFLTIASTTVIAHAGVTPSVLPPECVGPDGSGHVVCTYSVHNTTGTPSYSLSVPASATDVALDATGGSGGTELSPAVRVVPAPAAVLGGLGGHVTVDMDGASGSTVPGSTLTVVVGEAGRGFSACPNRGFPDGRSGGVPSRGR